MVGRVSTATIPPRSIPQYPRRSSCAEIRRSGSASNIAPGTPEAVLAAYPDAPSSRRLMRGMNAGGRTRSCPPIRGRMQYYECSVGEYMHTHIHIHWVDSAKEKSATHGEIDSWCGHRREEEMGSYESYLFVLYFVMLYI